MLSLSRATLNSANKFARVLLILMFAAQAGLGSASLAAEGTGYSTPPAVEAAEAAFSPNEGAEALVIKAIDSAQKQIRMLAYSFTSPPIVAALLRAKKRDVDVALVVDYKANVSEDHSGKSRAALNALSKAGIAVRTISVYAISHDKTIIVDGMHVEIGSFNYTASAAHRNSESVVVLWNHPGLAAICLKHWGRNWEQGVDFKATF